MPELREVFLVRIEAPNPVYVWSGVGDLDVPGDALAPAATYSGMGELIDIPAVKQLINGTADRYPFGVSGVSPAIQALATSEADEVNGAVVRIGSLPLDRMNQIAGPVDWEFEGVADVVSIDNASDESGARVRSVSLSVAAGDTGRSRAELASFTDADQRQRSPDDAIFSHVAGIAAGNTRRFGVR